MEDWNDKEIFKCTNNGTKKLSKEALTPKMIRKAVKILEKYKIKPDKEGFIEIENPTMGTDFLCLRVINKSELLNYKLVTDSKGNTKRVYVKPTLLLK